MLVLDGLWRALRDVGGWPPGGLLEHGWLWRPGVRYSHAELVAHLDLAAQVPDVHGEVLGVGSEVVAPDAVVDGGVVQHDAGKHHCTQPVVVPECRKTAHAITIADQEPVIDSDSGGYQHARQEAAMQSMLQSDYCDECQADRIAEHHRQYIEATEGDGRGAYADLQIIIAIDHRI